LEHARRSVDIGDYNWACFAAQQAAEKALEALLIVLRRGPPHIHDLTALYEDVKGELELSNEVAQHLSELSSHYVISRYPNAGVRRPSMGISRAQAERAISMAEEVVRAVARRLGVTVEG